MSKMLKKIKKKL